MRSEEDLVRILRTASDQAHPPSSGLGAAVAARRRRRRIRQRAQMALAAAAVVVIAGGTAAALSSGGGQAGPATQVASSAEPSAAEPLPEIRPASEVWPQAMAKVPAKDANGWKYQPVSTLSATEVVLATYRSFEKAGRIDVYDTATGQTRVLAEVADRKGYFVQEYATNDKYVAWYGETPNNSDQWADFWVAPREGGAARQVGEVTGDLSKIEKFGVTQDHVVWSLRDGGVYRMPLAGGDPEKIAESDGLHLRSWPWAVGYAPGELGERNQNRLVNLETRESVDISVPDGVKSLTCGREWCIGMRNDRALVQRPDGADSKLLHPMFSSYGDTDLLSGRFASLMLGPPDQGKHEPLPPTAAYDMSTGQLVGLGKYTKGGGLGLGSREGLVYWDEDAKLVQECKGNVCTSKEKGGGREYTVVNLAAVTPATQ